MLITPYPQLVLLSEVKIPKVGQKHSWILRYGRVKQHMWLPITSGSIRRYREGRGVGEDSLSAVSDML